MITLEQFLAGTPIRYRGLLCRRDREEFYEARRVGNTLHFCDGEVVPTAFHADEAKATDFYRSVELVLI